MGLTALCRCKRDNFVIYHRKVNMALTPLGQKPLSFFFYAHTHNTQHTTHTHTHTHTHTEALVHDSQYWEIAEIPFPQGEQEGHCDDPSLRPSFRESRRTSGWRSPGVCGQEEDLSTSFLQLLIHWHSLFKEKIKYAADTENIEGYVVK